MARCVLRYPARDLAPSGDLDRVACDQDVEVIDRTGTGLALVDVPDHALSRIRRMLPGWVVEPEQDGTLPGR